MEKIKVCADFFPPYQYIDEDGKVKGFQIGGFVSLLLGGMFSDRLKKSNIIISAAIIMSGGLCLIGITPPYVFLLVILFSLGMSTQILNILTSGYTCDIVSVGKQNGCAACIIYCGYRIAYRLSAVVFNHLDIGIFIMNVIGTHVVKYGIFFQSIIVGVAF